MAESTLALTKDDIQSRLGEYAGWGMGSVVGGDTVWTAIQQTKLDYFTKAGLQRFYFPEPLEGSRESYNWSFLRFTLDVPLASGKSTVVLPDSFGGIEGSINLMTSSGIMWGPVQVYNPAEVDQKFSIFPTTTGRPRMCAIRWKPGVSGSTGQRAELYVWPLADTAYTLRMQAYYLADWLVAAAPYALGGMAHADTVMESCLAVAEERLDDSQTIHREQFKLRLAASISMDRRQKASTLGYNGDNSDGMAWRRGDNHVVNPISYRGTVY